MIPPVALSLVPAALLFASVAAKAAPRKQSPAAKWGPDALIVLALTAWIPLAFHLSNSGLTLALGGWLLAATLLAFRGFQAKTALRLRVLPLSAVLLVAAGLVPEITANHIPTVALLVAALGSSYVALVSAGVYSVAITQLNQDGFGPKLESLPELWLLRKAHRIALGLTFALLTGLAAATVFLAPTRVWALAVLWLIVAVLHTGFLPPAGRARYYLTALLVAATAALVVVSLLKG